MRDEILVNGKKYKVEGEWSVEGITYCFTGVATLLLSNIKTPIDCRIPLSLVSKHGKEYFENEIETSLREYILSNEE